MREITVPKVPARAFNKNRPASDLLKRQVAQLQHVVEVATGGPVIATPLKKVKTEGQAAAFIAQVTRALAPATAPIAPAAPAAPTARHPPVRQRATKKQATAAHRSTTSPKKKTGRAK